MVQQELFYSVTGRVDVCGDISSATGAYVWLVEVREGGQWSPVRGGMFFHTRKEARESAKWVRDVGWYEKVRVLPYKACYDSRCRLNRQVRNERLDW